MTVCFLISKYDEARRAGRVADWTSYEDIGRSFHGRVLTVEEYRRTEDLYISAVESLADAVSADRFELRNVILNEPAPSWLGDVYDGKLVDLRTALLLVRSMLRNGLISCVLESRDVLRIGVETDFYLSVEIQQDAVEHLTNVERLGLHAVQVACWAEDDGDTPIVSRPADSEFWAEVTESARAARSTMVLERWARGSYGYRWYLVENGDPLPVTGWVRPQSLVTAFFDLKIRWVSRSGLIRSVGSAMVEDLPVVIFARSPSGGALETLTCGEGVALPSESELPVGGEFGFFVWPDEEASNSRLSQAVVPGHGGRIVARWPSRRTR